MIRIDGITVNKDKLIEIFERMITIRQFEQTVYYLFVEGLIPGTCHLYAGEEAVAAGVCANLKENDYILSTHRPHGHYIAKGADVKRLMAELLGRRDGCCKGKGGSMHVGDFQKGMIPAIAIVGANVPIANGVALTFKMRKTDQVAVSFFGDGAVNQGAWHEGLNLASVLRLPVVFICENNQYAASTHITKTLQIERISERARAYGFEGLTIDGNDVLQVFTAANRAVEKARRGGGPTLIECVTYRHGGHSRGDPGNYRPREEVEEWLKRDPIYHFRRKLIENAVATEEELKKAETEVEAKIREAVEFAKESPYPQPEEALEDTYQSGVIQ